MQSWGDAYRRLRKQASFRAWFGQHGIAPGPNDFTYKAETIYFSGVTGLTDPAVPSSGPVFGPERVIFPKGGVVLAITSGAYQEQQPTAGLEIPDIGSGRRSLYKLFIGFTDDEPLTVFGNTIDPVNGALMNVTASTNANALMGDGVRDEFPRDLLVPPSTGFFVSVQSNVPPTLGGVTIPPLFIHVVFHVLVPKGC